MALTDSAALSVLDPSVADTDATGSPLDIPADAGSMPRAHTLDAHTPERTSMTERPQASTEHRPSPGTASRRLESAEVPDRDGESALVELFVERLGDRIDDRVAASFDELCTERLAEPGPLQQALSRERRTGLIVVCTSLVLGSLTTILASGGPTALLILWTGLAVLNLAYFFRPR
ncbi:hypothetical protein [Streptomyces nodosus]|uniref:hypothetical protein n=1 Tax=Streptomyces nodosus TaxID=40318 RepID=UPI0038274F9F